MAFLVAATAHAKAREPKGEAGKADLAIEARRACMSGDYEKGISILTDLFLKSRAPDWVFNQGRCLEQNARYEGAVLRFEEYLRLTKGAKPEERAPAEEHLAECRARLAKTAPPPMAPLPAAPPPQVVVEPASPPVLAGTSVQAQAGVAPPSRRTGLRIAGIATTIVGAASLATGVLLNVKANALASDLNSPDSYERAKVSERSRYETASWIGYGAGAACVVGGSVLLYLGYRRVGAADVAVAPVFAPHQAGLSLRGAF